MFDDLINDKMCIKSQKINGSPFPRIVVPRESHGNRLKEEPGFTVWIKRTTPLEAMVVTMICDGYFECRELTGREYERLLNYIKEPYSEVESVRILGER